MIFKMKYFSLIIFFTLSFCAFNVEAQEKTRRKKKFKPSKVVINEVFFHDEQDPFTYKRERYILEWIEIFNGTSKSIYLRDYFLTDNLDSLSKWEINPINSRNDWLKKKKFF